MITGSCQAIRGDFNARIDLSLPSHVDVHYRGKGDQSIHICSFMTTVEFLGRANVKALTHAAMHVSRW